MYTGALINDLLVLVERMQRSAKAGVETEETKFFSGEPGWQHDVTNQAAGNDEARDLTDRTVPEAAWSEHG
jgi:hypothetical protein